MRDSRMSMNGMITYQKLKKYDSYTVNGVRVVNMYHSQKHRKHVYIHHDVICPWEYIKRFGLVPNEHYGVYEKDWYSLKGYMTHDEVMDMLNHSILYTHEAYCPDMGETKIISFPAGDTSECVEQTDVYSRPISKPMPSVKIPYLITRGKNGVIRYLYEIMDTIDLNPLDANRLQRLPEQYDCVRKHIRIRNQTFGFADAPIEYRFFILKKIHEFVPEYRMRNNPQGMKYLTLNEIGISTDDSQYTDPHINNHSEGVVEMEFVPIITYGAEHRKKQTFFFNDIPMARVHYRDDGVSILYVYKHCVLASVEKLKVAGFAYGKKPPSMEEGGSLSNYQCVLRINSDDIEYIANKFSEICEIKDEKIFEGDEAGEQYTRRKNVMVENEDDRKISEQPVALIDRDSFYRGLLLPDGFEAKRYDGMNRVHFKYRGVGFAVMDMNTYTYNLGSRDEYMHAVGVREFEYTHILGPNHAMLRGIPNTDTTVLYKLFDYISAERIGWDGIESDLIEEVNSIDSDIEDLSLEGDDKLAVVKTRVNQGVFRSLLLRRYGRCCLCGVDEVGVLNASHIRPWAASEPKEKTDVNNGLLLCPNHDRLFDKGYISFNEDGTILISASLSDENRTSLNVHDGMSIHLSDKSNEYMKYHRENIFIDEY